MASLLQVVNIHRWNFVAFLQIVMVNIALNQTWISLLMLLILTFHKYAVHLFGLLSAAITFSSGFFVPINDMPIW